MMNFIIKNRIQVFATCDIVVDDMYVKHEVDVLK
jgi:hypothetical protein